MYFFKCNTKQTARKEQQTLYRFASKTLIILSQTKIHNKFLAHSFCFMYVVQNIILQRGNSANLCN